MVLDLNSRHVGVRVRAKVISPVQEECIDLDARAMHCLLGCPERPVEVKDLQVSLGACVHFYP